MLSHEELEYWNTYTEEVIKSKRQYEIMERLNTLIREESARYAAHICSKVEYQKSKEIYVYLADKLNS